jgi:hypothetical protein
MVMNLRIFQNAGNFLSSRRLTGFVGRNLLHGVGLFVGRVVEWLCGWMVGYLFII